MTVFTTYNRRVMTKRFDLERRKKTMRRLFYHALDISGFVLWGMAVIIATACTVFVVAHR